MRLNWVLPLGWQRGLLLSLIVMLAIHFIWQKNVVIQSGAIEISPSILELSKWSASFESLNYAEIESAFADLRFESDLLVVDADTESQFSTALEQLPEGFENTHLDRVIFLAEQQFDDVQASQIISLLTKISEYKKQEVMWWNDNSLANAAGDGVENLGLLFELQDRVLGKELAKKLFLEQRRLMRHMTATVAIQKDESLSEKQKQAALEDLAHKLEQSAQ